MILSPGIAVFREGKGLAQQLRKASSNELGNRKEERTIHKWSLPEINLCRVESHTTPNVTSQTFLHQFSLITAL